MTRPVTVEQMRRIDAKTIDGYGIPSIVLMENAGIACAREILKSSRKLLKGVAVFCGPGNNGGDGFVIARHLSNRGVQPTVFFFQKPSGMKPDVSTNFKILLKWPVKLVDCSKRTPWKKIQSCLEQTDLVIDALFGSGLSRDIEEPFLTLIGIINQSRRPVISVDIPSGLNADTGKPMGACVRSRITVTLAAPKRGLLFKRAGSFTGKVKVADISIPRALLK